VVTVTALQRCPTVLLSWPNGRYHRAGGANAPMAILKDVLQPVVRVFWTSTKHTLRSPLPVEECKRRLRACKVARREEGLRGTIMWNRVSFYWSRLVRLGGLPAVRGQNSFAPYFKGRLQPHGTGTMLVGRMGMHTFTRVFMLVWFAMLALIAGGGTVAAAYAALQGDAPVLNALLTGATAFLMAAFGIGLVRFGVWWAEGEAERILAALTEALEAELLEDGAER
jgi:hypothetical protein